MQPTRPLKILFDNCIFSDAEFAELTTKEQRVPWGNSAQVVHIQGFKRKPLHRHTASQQQIDALWTIGRLASENLIKPYIYNEIGFEALRARIPMRMFNPLHALERNHCEPALERSKFGVTLNFGEYLSKGGKKDRINPKKAHEIGSFNQIPFFEWLCTLKKEKIKQIIEHPSSARFTDFEIESLNGIHWFQFLCQRSRSPENYPDVFHLWTAERNDLDALLTLDTRIVKLVSSVKKEKRKIIDIKTEALLPLDLLKKLKIETPDPVPIESDRFYSCGEALG